MQIDYATDIAILLSSDGKRAFIAPLIDPRGDSDRNSRIFLNTYKQVFKHCLGSFSIEECPFIIKSICENAFPAYNPALSIYKQRGSTITPAFTNLVKHNSIKFQHQFGDTESVLSKAGLNVTQFKNEADYFVGTFGTSAIVKPTESHITLYYFCIDRDNLCIKHGSSLDPDVVGYDKIVTYQHNCMLNKTVDDVSRDLLFYLDPVITQKPLISYKNFYLNLAGLLTDYDITKEVYNNIKELIETADSDNITLGLALLNEYNYFNIPRAVGLLSWFVLPLISQKIDHPVRFSWWESFPTLLHFMEEIDPMSCSPSELDNIILN